MKCATALRACLVTMLLLGAGCAKDDAGGPAGPPLLEIQYDDTSGRLHVTVHPELPAGHTLHLRVRPGDVGQLTCGTMVGELERIDTQVVSGSTFLGPEIDKAKFTVPIDATWLEGEPTAEMLAAFEASRHTIEVCLMKGTEVIRNEELDIRQALDRDGTGKFDDYTGDAVIRSVVGYAQACVRELGEIPFFPPIGDGDYGTYSCLDSVIIPTNVTEVEGTPPTHPEVQVDICDEPQFIYSLCEAQAETGRINGPRVARKTNDQGTDWVLLCRKSLPNAEGQYNDIAMIGHNPYTGKTCYFQNALYSRRDGENVPHPGDDIESEVSPQSSTTLWSGIQGGIGSGIECVTCHDSDPFIHTPWIDGAKDERGDPVIPKYGVHDGYVEGFNEAPYSLVDLDGQNWSMPKHLTSPEAAACTKCHRIGDGRWSDTWIARMEGADSFWKNQLTEHGKKFEKTYWMPADMEGIDESTWAESEFGKATTFLQACADNPSAEGCIWEELPTEQVVEVGELPTIELEGIELATEAAKILGARVIDPNDPRCTGEDGNCANRRCAECHSVSKRGLKHWKQLTDDANERCGLNKDPADMTQEEARTAVACLRAQPEDDDSVFAADKMGILTTGARYGYFSQLFRKAFGEDNWAKPYIRFKARVNMPKGTYAALSQREHAVVLKWFSAGQPHMDAVIDDPPPPTTCEPFVDTVFMEKHLGEMALEGWAAVNAENELDMFGCQAGSKAADCFEGYSERKEWLPDGPGRLVQVTQLDFRTSFWTRSSADGRYVANGGGSESRSTITDLVRGIDIGVDASYDPGFFPDNSGFIFQGGGTGICTQSMLSTIEEVTFDEEGCIKGTNINLYQHVARGVNDGDYFVINSQFTSDSGRTSKKDPIALFNADSTMKYSPMIFGGVVYEQLPAVIVDSPYEGDSVLSPSGQLVISRQAGGANNGPLSYVIRNVVAKRTNENYEITIDKVVAKVCTSGAKANISFDERFFVSHHYDAGGFANIFLVDMLTGDQHPVTNMPVGSYALFPHFRSDGWFYFLVREGANTEYVVASNLAIELAAAQ